MTKRKSFISFLITCCLMLSSLFVFTACGEDEPHKHEFSSAWSSNALYHWHASTCEHSDEVSDKARHDAGSWRTDDNQHWLVCSTCGYELSERENHTYENFVCECGKTSEDAAVRLITPNGQIEYFGGLTQEAINAAEEDSNFLLLKDLTITAALSVDKNITIDFNGHTVTAYNETDNRTLMAGGFDIAYRTSGARLSLYNGTLKTQKWGAWIQNGGYLLVGKDFTIHANTALLTNANAVTVVEQGSQVDIEGTVEVEGETFCVSGNGSVGDGGVTINVNDGARVIGGSAGIYMPNEGFLNIGAATVSGQTAVYIKAGNTTINGATLVANGKQADYVCRTNGADPTGDAIVLDSMGYPGGQPPKLTIVSAEITSENGVAIAIYKVNDNEYEFSNETGYEPKIEVLVNVTPVE